MKQKPKLQNSEIEAVHRLPKTLKELITYATQSQGQSALSKIHLGERPVFSGCGMYLLAAHYAARLCRQAGIRAAAYSSAEIESYPTELFIEATSFVDFGSHYPGGVTEKFKHIPYFCLAVDTNQLAEETPLPGFADAKLGELGLIHIMMQAWLMVRQNSGQWDGSENTKLQAVRQRAQLMADGCDPYLSRCRDLLKYSPRWILLGGEEQCEGMKFTSLLLAKKANRLVPWVIYEDYAGNMQQHLDPDAALIHFRGTEDTRIDLLLDQAEEKGAVVVEVTEGFYAPHRSQKNFSQGVEANLLPLLGCMAGNLLALSDEIG